MFIAVLEYIKPVDEVDKHLEAHREYLRDNYQKGLFIASGRRNPRTGGVILARGESKDSVEQLLKQDPFYVNQVAQFQLVEFSPTMTGEGFEALLNC